MCDIQINPSGAGSFCTFSDPVQLVCCKSDQECFCSRPQRGMKISVGQPYSSQIRFESKCTRTYTYKTSTYHTYCDGSGSPTLCSLHCPVGGAFMDPTRGSCLPTCPGMFNRKLYRMQLHVHGIWNLAQSKRTVLGGFKIMSCMGTAPS